MKAVRDIALTLVVLSLLLGVVVALPIIIPFIIIGVIGFIIYAVIHDDRIKRERGDDVENDKDEADRGGS